jgi:hypothetical protein
VWPPLFLACCCCSEVLWKTDWLILWHVMNCFQMMMVVMVIGDLLYEASCALIVVAFFNLGPNSMGHCFMSSTYECVQLLG